MVMTMFGNHQSKVEPSKGKVVRSVQVGGRVQPIIFLLGAKQMVSLVKLLSSSSHLI
jgi:hypothetical protein